jgi:putative oxidoreductase
MHNESSNRRRTTTYVPYGALLLRLTLGLVFVAHALLKLLVFSLPGTAASFGRASNTRLRTTSVRRA